MRASRRKNAKGKVVIRSAASAACALALLLAPAAAKCADNPAKPTVLDCYGDSERPLPPPWVTGTSGPDTCWGAKLDSDFGSLGITPPPGSCQTETVGAHVLRSGELALRRLPAERALRPNAGAGRPALAACDFPPRAAPAGGGRAEAEEAAEGAYTLRHEAALYPRAKVGFSGSWMYTLKVRGAPAAGLIRKLHRADNFGWTDETGQSSYLMTVDEGLREQIGLFMKHCGIDPAPAP